MRAALEIYRALPAKEEFNQGQRDPVDVPLFPGCGEGSPFAALLPMMAAGLRACGCTHVQTGLIPGSVHYVVDDQPQAVAGLIERHAEL